MRSICRPMIYAMSLAATLASSVVLAAFDSGSSGADGAFAPTANTVVALPPNGVLNYTTVTIPAGVTVSFQKNASNTPVVMLATGAVKIAGTININGGTATSTLMPVVLGVTNKGGVGGPGGFNGGMGGAPEQNRTAGYGYGPGGGGVSLTCNGNAAGSFATRGGGNDSACPAGQIYGSNAMLPVIGGSGGAGGNGGINASEPAGPGGGGGGGALLIVSSASVELTGQILAKGGSGVCGSSGAYHSAGGSGGMVRIIAPGYTGGGSIDVSGGPGVCAYNGGTGRSSIEVIPAGGTFNLALLPSLAITSIGGQAVPAMPTGSGDVTAPLDLGNPLAVVVSASGVPPGSVVKLTLNNNSGTITTANTPGLAGTQQASTATVNITIPAGSSVLMASTTYTLTLAQGDALKVYAMGERVDKVSLTTVMGGAQSVTLITVSGKEYPVPAGALMAAINS